MNTTFTSHGVNFEWDEDKASKNIKKHGVSFEQASEVFFDPFLRIVDVSQSGEERDAVLGYTEKSQLLFVVHVIRHEDIIRIVSARAATAVERKNYENV